MMLLADNLFASAGKTPILRGAALEVAAGETARLTGRNGAGKTTFMRAVMGLIKIDGGKIMFDGADLTRAPASRRARLGIGYMPEDRKLVPDFTVEENILLPMWATGRRPEAARLRRICELIPELGPVLPRRAMSLSGGQQKLAALARALNCGERLLLLDEPFEGIAPALGRRLAEIIVAAQTPDMAALIAESDSAHSAALSHSCASMERGVIAAKISGRKESA